MQQASEESSIEAFCRSQNLEAEQSIYIFRHANPKNLDTKCIPVVKTILERCQKEQSLNRLQVPLDDPVQRVSFYTGLPSTYLTQLASEENVTLEKCLMVKDLVVILNCLKEEYYNEKYPTIKQVYEAVLLFRQYNNMEVIEYDKFCQQMISLHFSKWPTKNSEYLIMEYPKVTFERYKYLSSLQKYRNKDIHIYYLDKRIIGNSISSENESINFMFFYAVLRNTGYVRGLYCTSPDKNEYIKWITDIVLPLLNPASLVIMTDSPFHETAATNVTRYNSKAEMLKWLTTKDIPCSDNMHKAELYELISKYCLKCEQSNIECVLKAHGHEVLLQPASIKDCTPTELFWNYLKSEVSLTTTKDYDPKLQDKIQSYINKLTQLQWIGYEESIVKVEKLLLNLHHQIDKALEKYELDTVACDFFSDGNDYPNIVIDRN